MVFKEKFQTWEKKIGPFTIFFPKFVWKVIYASRGSFSRKSFSKGNFLSVLSKYSVDFGKKLPIPSSNLHTFHMPRGSFWGKFSKSKKKLLFFWHFLRIWVKLRRIWQRISACDQNCILLVRTNVLKKFFFKILFRWRISSFEEKNVSDY